MCEDVRVAMSARLDGEDPGLAPEQIEDHLSECAGCAVWLVSGVVWARASNPGAHTATAAKPIAAAVRWMIRTLFHAPVRDVGPAAQRHHSRRVSEIEPEAMCDRLPRPRSDGGA